MGIKNHDIRGCVIIRCDKCKKDYEIDVDIDDIDVEVRDIINDDLIYNCYEDEKWSLDHQGSTTLYYCPTCTAEQNIVDYDDEDDDEHKL